MSNQIYAPTLVVLQIQKFLLVAIVAISLLAINVVSANGGDQRLVAGGKYYVNLSRAPFTPRVGIKTSMLVSFFDVGANQLIKEDLLVKVRIAKFGGGQSAKRTFIFEDDNLLVKGGVLEFAYTFGEPGLHEIFFDFTFAKDQKKIYEVPDFLLDVQSANDRKGPLPLSLFAHFVFFIIGLMLGLFLSRKMNVLKWII